MSTTETTTVAKTEHTLTPDQAALIITSDLRLEMWLPKQEDNEECAKNALLVSQIGARLIRDPNFTTEMDEWFRKEFATDQEVIYAPETQTEEAGCPE